jgi:hypothetical protein
MILKLLNWQGIAGIAATLALAVLLMLQKAETRHSKKQSAGFEQLYHQEQSAFATTVADYRQAAEAARAADRANSEHVVAEQHSINERTVHDYEARLAAARAAAQRLRLQSGAATDPGVRGGTPMSGLPVAAGGASEGAGENGLSQSDRLTATEQAIQLDELIKWVRAQAAVDNNPGAVASPQGD